MKKTNLEKEQPKEIFEVIKKGNEPFLMQSKSPDDQFQRQTHLRRKQDVEKYRYFDNKSFCYISGLVDRREMYFMEVVYYILNDSVSSFVSFGLFLPNEFVGRLNTPGFIRSPYQLKSCLEYQIKSESLKRALKFTWSGGVIDKGIIITDFDVISVLKVHHESIRIHSISPCFVKIKCPNYETTTNFLIKNMLIVNHGLCVLTKDKEQTIRFDKEEPIKIDLFEKKLVDHLDSGSYYEGQYEKNEEVGLIVWNGEGSIYRKSPRGDYVEIKGVWKHGKLNLENCKIMDSYENYYSSIYIWGGKELQHSSDANQEAVAIWGPIDLNEEDLRPFLSAETRFLYLDCYYLNTKTLTIGLSDAALAISLERIIIGNYGLAKTEYLSIYDLPALKYLTFGYHCLNDCLNFVLFGILELLFLLTLGLRNLQEVVVEENVLSNCQNIAVYCRSIHLR